ncbi:MAG TPA: hypothetical protein VHR45_25570 [Thermoanaerobaculia bacterium]|nr:hypothetical protein [Thermoanaerobaculia bacterium]
MSFKLFLKFTGLCAFVPHTSGKAARVLLVDTSGDPSDHCAPELNEPHEPVLVFDRRFVAAANRRQPDMTFSNGNPMAICYLHDMDLAIGAAREDALFIENGPIGNCPIDNDHRSLAWVAALPEIDQSAGEVHAECLAASDVHPSVAARVRLTEGSLRTTELSGIPQSSWVRWSFQPRDGGRTIDLDRAMAEVVELEVDVPGSEVRLETARFRGSLAALPPLILAPRNGQVTAWVKNMPLLDVLGKRSPEAVVVNQRRAQDAHFEHFYTLSPHDPGPGRRATPFPVGTCLAAAPPPFVPTPMCPPARFTASPLA